MQTPLVTCTQNLPFRWKHQCSLARQESVGGCALLVQQQQRCKDAIFHCNQPAPVIQSSLTQSNLPTPLKWPRRTPHPHFSFHPYLSWQLVQCGPNSFGGWSSLIDWPKTAQSRPLVGRVLQLKNHIEGLEADDRMRVYEKFHKS